MKEPLCRNGTIGLRSETCLRARPRQRGTDRLRFLTNKKSAVPEDSGEKSRRVVGTQTGVTEHILYAHAVTLGGVVDENMGTPMIRSFQL